MSGSGSGGGGIFEQMFRMPITFFNSGLGILNQTMRGMGGAAGSAGVSTGGSGLSNRGGGTGDSRIEVRGEADTRSRRGRETGDAEMSVRFTEDTGERRPRDSGRGRDRDYESDREREHNRARDTYRVDRGGDDRERQRGRDYGGSRGRGADDIGGRRSEGGGRDRDLSGDRLKLVRYKVLFVKRDYEVAFPEREELVAGDFNDTDFTAWKIAEFIQRLDEEQIPGPWREKNYPRAVAPGESPAIGELREADKKYLRIYFEVLARYDREEFHHDERQVGVLEEIRDAIKQVEC